MRALLFLILAVVVLALVGWITFNVSADKASVNVETEKIEHDTEHMMESGKALLQDAGTAIDRATDDGDTDDGDTNVENDRNVVEPPTGDVDIETVSGTVDPAAR